MNPYAVTVDRLINEYADLVGGEPEDGNSTERHAALIRDARKVVRRLAAEIPETVEQGVLMPKATTIPDGWSFDDVNDAGRFTGKWWGLRIRRGEPMIFQKGHVLLIRQWELYSDRDRGYYERISRVPGQTVLVVIGFMGKRDGYFSFENGEMGPIESGDVDDLADWIVNWLEHAWQNPLADWDKTREGL